MECLRHLLSTQGVAVSGPTTSPPLSLSLTLTQLGGDSLAAMRISSLIQEAFCTDVSAQFLLKHALIDVYHLILSQLLPSQQPRYAIASVYKQQHTPSLSIMLTLLLCFSYSAFHCTSRAYGSQVVLSSSSFLKWVNSTQLTLQIYEETITQLVYCVYSSFIWYTLHR